MCAERFEREGTHVGLTACFLYSVAYRRLVPEVSKQTVRARIGIYRLRCAVHIDALRLSPSEYLQAIWWRLTGKKLRSRMRLAPILARSPLAYRLWQAERRGKTVPKFCSAVKDIELNAVVSLGEGMDQTVASCRKEGLKAHAIADPKDLGELGLPDNAWLVPLRAGDILARGASARYRLAAASCEPECCVLYADDDVIDSAGDRSGPHLKPNWNSELFRHHDFVTGASMLRGSALSVLSDPGSDWARSLTQAALDLCEEGGIDPVHVPHVLHHRQGRPSPNFAKSIVQTSHNWPSVTVVIPTRNRLDLLRTCLQGLQRTIYEGDLDILVVDNGSDEHKTLEYLAALNADFARVLRDDGPFYFAALTNRAVRQASSELLCFLNNDIEIRDPNWLAPMVQQALREDVGAVGARLLYPNGLIQHAGVVIGIGGAAAHAHRMIHPEEEGYFHRHALPQFVSAVTAACLVVSCDKFNAVRGFDEDIFAVSFNDVDLCLRLTQRGWRSVYEPRATLVHHESVSRGLDQKGAGAARQAREVAALQTRWNTALAIPRDSLESADPFHHPGLSPLSERFVLRL